MKSKTKSHKKLSLFILTLTIAIGVFVSPFSNNSVYAEGDYGVTVDVSVSSTSLNTFTNPRIGGASGTPPDNLTVYVDINILSENVTGAYVDIPLTYQVPGTFNPATGSGDFFIYNASKTEAALGDYILSSSVTNGVLRLVLNDNLSTGKQTQTLYFDFNSEYDAEVPFEQLLWEVKAEAYAKDGFGVVQLSDSATPVSVYSNAKNSFMLEHPPLSNSNYTWSNGTIVQRLIWRYQQSYENIIVFGADTYLYVDFPKDTQVTGLTGFVYKETYTDSNNVEYDRYIMIFTDVNDFNELNYAGNVAHLVSNRDVTITPPTTYTVGDTFSIKFGLCFELVNNASLITKEAIISYSVIDQKVWDFHPGTMTHGTGSSVGDVTIALEKNNTVQYAVNIFGKAANTAMYLGYPGYSYSASPKNLGTGNVEGVSMVLEQVGTGAEKINFHIIRVAANRKDTTYEWNEYQITYKYNDGTSVTETIVPTSVAITELIDLAIPIQSTRYIKEIVITAMGNDATNNANEGILLPGNGFALGYVASSWPDNKWYDGTSITESTVIEVNANLTWLNENGDKQNLPIIETTKKKVFYNVDETIYPTVTVSGSSLTGKNPGEELEMSINAKVDNQRGPSNNWVSPYIVIRIPKELELVTGSGNELIDTASGLKHAVEVTKINNTDTKYDYYAFKTLANYEAAPTIGASSFTIPFKLRVADGTTAGTYNIESIVLTSYGSTGELLTKFDVMDNLEKNSLSDTELGLYGLGSGTRHLALANTCSITVVRMSDMRSETTIKSTLTNNQYMSANMVAAEHGTEVQMKLSIINYGNVDLKDLKLYDILPYNGDTRGSSGGTTLKSVTIAGVNPTIYYTDSTTLNPLTTSLQSFDTNGWSTDSSDGDGATAFYIDFGALIIEPNDRIEVILTFAVPGTPGTDQIAYNQFSYSANPASGTGGQINLLSPIKGFTTASKTLEYKENIPTQIPTGERIENFPENTFASVIGDDSETIAVTALIPTLAGYVFDGWNTQADGKGIDYDSITDNIVSFGVSTIFTLYAKWKPAIYAINYDVGSGSNGNNPNTYTYGVGVTAFAEATLTGHSFKGWYKDDTYTEEVKNISTTNLGVVSLVAKLVPNVHDITYVLDGGTKGGNPDEYTYGIGVPTLDDASKSGFRFDGWYSDDKLTISVDSIPTTLDEPVTLYAKFTDVTTPTLSLSAGNEIRFVVNDTANHPVDYDDFISNFLGATCVDNSGSCEIKVKATSAQYSDIEFTRTGAEKDVNYTYTEVTLQLYAVDNATLESSVTEVKVIVYRNPIYVLDGEDFIIRIGDLRGHQQAGTLHDEILLRSDATAIKYDAFEGESVIEAIYVSDLSCFDNPVTGVHPLQLVLVDPNAPISPFMRGNPLDNIMQAVYRNITVTVITDPISPGTISPASSPSTGVDSTNSLFIWSGLSLVGMVFLLKALRKTEE